MQVTVHVPGLLRTFSGGKARLVVSADTVRDAIDAMDRDHPGLRAELLDERGLRRFVSIFLRHEDIRSLDGLETQLRDGDELELVPALAGG
jgi:molybdopterin synthase sulfur carrier subunit